MATPSIRELTSTIPKEPLAAHERQGQLLAALQRVDEQIAKASEAQAKELEAVRAKYAEELSEREDERRQLADALRKVTQAVVAAVGGPEPATATSRSRSARLPKALTAEEMADPAAVLKALRQIGKGNAKAVGEEIGEPTGAVAKALSALKEQGKVKASGQGRYRDYEPV